MTIDRNQPQPAIPQAEVLHPGVYIEEIQRGPRPIEGVPTSTAAILGEAERGSVVPRLVTSYADYRRWFGDALDPGQYLQHAVRGFFENGGSRAFVCRLVGRSAVTASAVFGGFVVRAAGPGSWGSRVFARISPATTKDAHGNSIGFRLQVAYWSGATKPFDPFTDEGRRASPRPALIEDFDDLVTDESSPNFYGTRLSGTSVLTVIVRGNGVPAQAGPEDGAHALSGGADDPVVLGADDFGGRAEVSSTGRSIDQGLAALEQQPYRDVALVYAPAASPDIAKAVIAHCEHMRFRFAVIDSAPGEKKGQKDGQQEPGSSLDPRNTIADTTYAAFYYPWLFVADPRTAGETLVPPGGHVLGVYARCDSERGVFKAPANEIVRGAVALESAVTDRMQDELNPRGVNVIREFPGRGIRVWGARTMTSDSLWKYVNVRRLFIFLERSIDEGTQWVVFEPNDERLWARVVDTVRLFLRAQWRQGALLGGTEEEAFFVRCDRTTMTQDDILNGRLICEIGVAPVRPAEFVIFRIVQHTAEAKR